MCRCLHRGRSGAGGTGPSPLGNGGRWCDRAAEDRVGPQRDRGQRFLVLKASQHMPPSRKSCRAKSRRVPTRSRCRDHRHHGRNATRALPQGDAHQPPARPADSRDGMPTMTVGAPSHFTQGRLRQSPPHQAPGFPRRRRQSGPYRYPYGGQVQHSTGKGHISPGTPAMQGSRVVARRASSAPPSQSTTKSIGSTTQMPFGACTPPRSWS